MDSQRSSSSMFIFLCIQISVCLLGSISCSSSLWGKKVKFNGRQCLWQLDPRVVVPGLEELTVCVLLRRDHPTKWTAFVYKAPGEKHIELGLGGRGDQLDATLFGKKWILQKGLPVNEWHSICFTWSSLAQRVRLYINGTNHLERPINCTLPCRLAQNGTLTLGLPHYIDVNGHLQTEDGKTLFGDIGMFRMWAREWRDEELSQQGCADGDVLSWDLRHWNYNCDPQPDSNLRCAWSIYKIKMQVFLIHSNETVNPIASRENIISSWMESIFSPNVSVHHITVSPPSEAYHVGNEPVAPHIEQAKDSRGLLKSTFDMGFSCEVYVNVNPATAVEFVQTYISEQLGPTFSCNFFSLTADNNSLIIQPVGSFPSPTKQPPTVTIGATISGTYSTHSLPVNQNNASTTKKPLDVNDTAAVSPDTFFRINLLLNMTSTPREPRDIIERWLIETLEVNNTIAVLNLRMINNDSRNMEPFNRLMISRRQYKEYECTFHAQVFDSWNDNKIEKLIHEILTSGYENGTAVIQTICIVIKCIAPDNCPEDTTQTIYGPFTWPESFPQTTQSMRCKDSSTDSSSSGRAYRFCKLDSHTDTTSWADPEMEACKPLMSITDLNKVNVTSGNAADIVGMIRDLIDAQFGSTGVGEGNLNASQLETVVGKLEDIVDVSTVTPALSQDIVRIIGDILVSKSDISPVASNVLNLTERIGNKMVFHEESASLTVPLLALSMVNVDPNKFSGLSFGVSSFSSDFSPKVFINQSFVSKPFFGAEASISLPSVLHEFLSHEGRNSTRLQFQFCGEQDLFKDPGLIVTPQSNWTLNTYVVSASINNSHVQNLKEQLVVVTLRHQTPTEPDDKVLCVFWDFQRNGGQGGWNSHGCKMMATSVNQTSCHCDHLTHFAVLIDVFQTPISEKDSQILSIISYLGCGISSIFLGITLLTYMAFEKLRQDYPSKILINLSAALLGLNLLFLLDSWLSSFSSYGLCIVTAASLHYFLLASFIWMGLEAIHMYFALVKVFNIYVPSYILKFCTLGWGIPLVIVSLVLAIDKDAYGSTLPEDAAVVLQSSEPFCWLQSSQFFYVTVVAIVLLILLCNIAVFIVVLLQIRNMRTNKPAGKSYGSLHDLRAVASLTFLLGLTWPIAFFALEPARVVLLYMFSVLNSLQGFFIFMFHCLMKENVRKQWRIHLCCGRFRLSDYSDWSRSVTQGGRSKQDQLVHSPSSGSVNTSSIRKVSDSSTESAPAGHHEGE